MTTTAPRADRPQTMDAWRGFVAGPWQDGVDVRDFIQRNYTPYAGDAAFLAGPTPRTTGDLGQADRRCSRTSASAASTTSTRTPRRTITAHAPGYIDKDNELIVGLQTDAPLKRAIMPNGGWRMVEDALRGLRLRARPDRQGDLHQVPQDPQRRRLRRLPAAGARPRARSHIITGLPDAYGRGRIIGDYRRVALYGVDALIAAKKRRARRAGHCRSSSEDVIRDREENAEQIRALRRAQGDGRVATASTSPARPATAREAVQWLYFAYLAAVKEQNGAAMSLGRTSTFLDVYLAARPRRGP